MAVEGRLDRIGDAAVGEDDAAHATFDGAERGLDFDHHPPAADASARLWGVASIWAISEDSSCRSRSRPGVSEKKKSPSAPKCSS